MRVWLQHYESSEAFEAQLAARDRTYKSITTASRSRSQQQQLDCKLTDCEVDVPAGAESVVIENEKDKQEEKEVMLDELELTIPAPRRVQILRKLALAVPWKTPEECDLHISW